MMGSNPSVIQLTTADAIPLILIHDGGGTCTQYFRLANLNRPVYGIHNPRHLSGRAWDGGIPEMAAVYADLVRTVVPDGPVLLGGWSLGGVLALEVAQRLPCHSVQGLVMIDSVFPQRHPADTRLVVPYRPAFTEAQSLLFQRATNRAMDLSAAMLDRWPPSEPPLNQPPAVLLRATDHYTPAEENYVTRVDIHRNELLLGWDRYSPSFIQDVLFVPGHHFAIFSHTHLDRLSYQLDQACQMLTRK
ncbi:uncharacterized protein K452DRAFT_305349 [Aplosporella prunicola CBS 121167]|uniref:Thioesterase TesA-like domain-containing protein n=1 Tax=Aplosporella prunicola CBS 121167 TaxID=1176127 RepID=A0A6A6BML6_9PEZI|nr:uncharacterized protein K452DRAFT_305349 [Aplosporella prunicola CBS 121167]KAF2145306.1 hypothetical protein K452DRAFT_305349 [Aplosporella prunicola CBS 121167]